MVKYYNFDMIISLGIIPKTLQNDTFCTIKIVEYIQNSDIDMKDLFLLYDEIKYLGF